MKRVTVVEMQSRLCEILAQPDADLTQVTYQGTPVVAVLALERYQALLTQITYPQEKPVVAVLALERYQTLQESTSDLPNSFIEVTREGLTSAQLLFHSYTKRLVPLLRSEELFVRIVEVTRRKKPVGALLAWNDWLRLSESSQAEELRQEDHRLHLTAARNHLLKIPEQFAREERAGIFAPITVFKQGESVPVMAIVSRQWLQYVTEALSELVDSNGAIRHDSVPTFQECPWRTDEKL
jgi:PHD/YefM family antitoxin component YafN of YafNO toxin-antitoxin module